MKILFLCHRIPYPPNKGDKIRSFNEVKHLSKHHEIDLAALVDKPEDCQYEADLKKYCRNVSLASIHPIWDKLKSLLFPMISKPLSAGYFYSWNLQKKVDRWLADNPYDAVVCFSSSMAEYVFSSSVRHQWVNGKKSRCIKNKPKLIMDFCDLDSDKWRQYAGRSSFPFCLIYQLEFKLLLAYEKRINRLFDRSIFISRQESDLFYRLFPLAERVSVIPNGVDHDYFSEQGYPPAASQEDSPILVFTGAMDYHANADGAEWFCRDILPLIRKTYSRVQFYIVGSNPHPKVKELEQLEGVHVTGFVDDIRHYYEMADVCVIPLRVARGVQNKVLEAMSMNKAVVTTSTAVKGIAPEHNSGLMIADAPEDFSSKVVSILKDNALKQELGRKARKYVTDRFHWEANMEKLNAFI